MKKQISSIIEKVKLPDQDSMNGHDIKSSLRSLARKLRDAYYKVAPKSHNVYETPFGGPIGDSIGPWPEFILRGLPCQKSKIGCCTPCFYSRMPQVERLQERLPDVYESLVRQVEYVIKNFNALVVHNQWGPVAWPKPITIDSEKPVALVITPTGSFFDKTEFPFDVRKRTLSLLDQHSKRTSTPLALHIETHAEHFVEASEDESSFNEIVGLLSSLNGRVLFGFESCNAYVRNVLYNKHLADSLFDNAMNIAKKKKIPVGAFVFVGINPLNDVEIIADAIATFRYLKDREITPVVMFHNVQPYTMQELLYLYEAHELPDPRTVLEVVRNLVLIFPDNPRGKIDSWLVADPVGGPPPPKYNIFSARRHCTCEKCSSSIKKAIIDLRLTRNVAAFLEEENRLSKCDCSKHFLDLLSKQLEKVPALERRVKEMVKKVEDKSHDYVSVIRPMLNKAEEYDIFKDTVPQYEAFDPLLKAELLCYGLRVEPNFANDLLEFNSYIHEAGFVHAAHFIIGNNLINTCIAEEFCKSSPYLLGKRNGNYEIVKEDVTVAPCSVLRIPRWCEEEIDGYKLGNILRPHSENILSGMPNPNCYYFEKGQECSFCSLRPLQKTTSISPDLVALTALKAFEFNSEYELALSGGTSETPDRSAKYFCNIAAAIRQKVNMPISVELVPPDDNQYLDELHDSGVSAVIMNIEIWDSELRALLCPGKSCVSLQRYIDAIQYAVGLFGKGQVASVLMAGIQRADDVIKGAKALIDLGAIPTIIPFKPFDNCRMAHFPRTEPARLLEIYQIVANLLKIAELRPHMQKGCTKCGGCSLENLTEF